MYAYIHTSQEVNGNYHWRVVNMFNELLNHYIYTHEMRWMCDDEEATPLYELTIARRNECAKRSLALARDILSCVGVQKDQSYIHDLVYGLNRLYDYVGTPLRAAMQGAEHVNKQMKDVLRVMTCAGGKGGKGKYGDLAQMARVMQTKSHVISQMGEGLPHDKYSMQLQGRLSWNQPSTSGALSGSTSASPSASAPTAGSKGRKRFCDALASSATSMRSHLDTMPPPLPLPAPRKTARLRRLPPKLLDSLDTEQAASARNMSA